MLRERGMPAQAVIGREAGVSQATVSRAIGGLIKGPSKGAIRLLAYARSRTPLLVAGARAGDRTIKAGEDPSATGPAPDDDSSPRRAGTVAGSRLPAEAGRRENRERLKEEAIVGLREYLADEFDPSLVVEQLAVLRRAQKARGTRRARRLRTTAA